MYAVNLGTRGVQEALDVLEYANIRSGTALSDAADHERPGRPVRHPDVVPRQRDGRPVAARPPQRRRLRQARRRRPRRRCGSSTPTSSSSCAAARTRRCRRSASWERTVLRAYLRRRRLHLLPRLLRGARRGPRRASSPSPSTWTTSSRRSSPPRTRYGPSSAARSGSTSRSTSGTSGTSPATTRSEQITDVEQWPIAPRLLEDAYSVDRRGRRRQPADLAAEARRPGDRCVAWPSWST